ncbi:MAG: acyl-CoA dehydrogenase family protein [Armatimonadetes bacterium]|nr:acyl-CoA dehydrogenase family protein [Armatimonadota bacterium]
MISVHEEDKQRAGLGQEERDALIRSFRDFMAKELTADRVLELDAKEEFPAEILKELFNTLGLHFVLLPQKYLPEDMRGMEGNAKDLAILAEEFARVDLGTATAFLAVALGLDPILVGATPCQLSKWIPMMAEGKILAYCVTEPNVGSNVAAIETIAERQYDSSGALKGYKITGNKQFITNGGVAELYVVLAMVVDGRTSSPGAAPARQGPSFFLVDRNTPGLTPGKSEEKHGIRASNTTSVALDGVFVTADRLVGEKEGEGLEQASKVFAYTRTMVAAFGVGCASAALEMALDYAKTRMQFGKPLTAHQGYTHELLVPHSARMEAARAYIYELADRIDGGEQNVDVEGAIAKLYATEFGFLAVDAALQALGGYGYLREYRIEKMLRDIRITRIYEGTSQILRLIIGLNRIRGGKKLYEDLTKEMRSLSEKYEDLGAEMIAGAAKALAENIEGIRKGGLLKQQAVLFKLADDVASVEIAAALARKAANRREKGEKGANLLAIFSDLVSREAEAALLPVSPFEHYIRKLEALDRASDLLVGRSFDLFDNAEALKKAGNKAKPVLLALENLLKAESPGDGSVGALSMIESLSAAKGQEMNLDPLIQELAGNPHLRSLIEESQDIVAAVRKIVM